VPLDLLRMLAFDGPLTGFVRNPPGVLREPQPMTGFHLQFDTAFLRRISEVIQGGFWPGNGKDPPRYSDARFRKERRTLAEFAIASFGTDSGRSLETLIDWPERCWEMNYPKRAKPVTIVIDYGEEISRGWLADLPPEFENYPIRYRYSPPAQAQVGAGSGVQGVDFGTLGGVLEDGVTNQSYGVTCAHVGGSTGQQMFETDSNGNIVAALGSVVDSTIPPSVTVGCNLHASPGAGIDAALIDLNMIRSIQPTPSLTVAPILGIDQDDLIAFVGCKSGHVAARVAAATIWKKADVAGQIRCFGDIFSVSHRLPAYVLSAVSKGGDSGSWILEDPPPQSSSTRWIGMLVAGDKQQNQSLACYSKHVFDWAKGRRPNLQLPP